MFIIAALVSLTVLIVVHEFGHFIAAKLVKIWPEEFGIGLPPKVWGKKWKGTLWSINAIPLGGFVRLHGEVSDPKMSRPDEAYINKSKFARAFVALAGIFMNFLYAVVAFTIINTMIFWSGVPSGVLVEEVKPDSAAFAAGIQMGDEIIYVADQMVSITDRFPAQVAMGAGKTIDLQVKRGEELKTLNVTLPQKPAENQGLLGVVFVSTAKYNPQGFERIMNFISMGVSETVMYTKLTLDAFVNLGRSILSLKMPEGLVSPLGVVGVTAEAARQGWLTLLGFSAIISVNLAIFNLLPFPPLDGSRVLFLAVESLIGRKRLVIFEEKAHVVGMSLLFLLAGFLLIREVPLLLSAGSLSGFVDSLIKAN